MSKGITSIQKYDQNLWSTLPKSFIYPLWLNNFIAIILTSIVFMLGFTIQNHYAFYAYMFALGVYFVKYLCLVFRHIAQGFQYSPKVSLSFFGKDFTQLFPFFIFSIILFALNYEMSFLLSAQLKPVYFTLLLCYLPAAFALILLHESVLAALSLKKLYAFINTDGSQYLLMIVTLIFACFGLEKTYSYIGIIIDGNAYLFAICALRAYLTISMCHLLARFVYFNHEKMGYQAEIALSEFGDKCMHSIKKPKAVIQAEAYIMQAEFDAALSLLNQEMENNTPSIEIHELYFKLLNVMGKQQEVAKYAQNYISRLITHSKGLLALQFYQDLCSSLENFSINNDKCLFELAKLARHYGKFQLACDLFENILKEHTSSDYTPFVLWLMGKTLIERYAQDTTGYALLKRLHEEFPEHPLAEQARAYPTI